MQTNTRSQYETVPKACESQHAFMWKTCWSQTLRFKVHISWIRSVKLLNKHETSWTNGRCRHVLGSSAWRQQSLNKAAMDKMGMKILVGKKADFQTIYNVTSFNYKKNTYIAIFTQFNTRKDLTLTKNNIADDNVDTNLVGKLQHSLRSGIYAMKTAINCNDLSHS